MEIGKIDLRQALENMKALREAEPEVFEKIANAAMNAVLGNEQMMDIVKNAASRRSDDDSE